MRFLKKKIQSKLWSLKKLPELNSESVASVQQNEYPFSSIFEENNLKKSDIVFQEVLLPMRKPRKKTVSPEGNSKNIVKNYGKALCAFSCSEIAMPYIERLINEIKAEKIDIQNFIAFIKLEKEKVSSIESIRKLLLVTENDKDETILYKKIFQKISIIFLKYFAVNWIFSGKLMHKMTHLKYRFRMLRRIQDPEHFTYLKTKVNIN